MLDSNAVTVNNYGWVSFDWLSATIDRRQLLPGHDPDGSGPVLRPDRCRHRQPDLLPQLQLLPGRTGLGAVPAAGFHDPCMGMTDRKAMR